MINPFTHLFRARDKPGKRLPQNAVSAAPSFYFGTSVSGKSVTARSAIQLSMSLRPPTKAASRHCSIHCSTCSTTNPTRR